MSPPLKRLKSHLIWNVMLIFYYLIIFSLYANDSHTAKFQSNWRKLSFQEMILKSYVFSLYFIRTEDKLSDRNHFSVLKYTLHKWSTNIFCILTMYEKNWLNFKKSNSILHTTESLLRRCESKSHTGVSIAILPICAMHIHAYHQMGKC